MQSLIVSLFWATTAAAAAALVFGVGVALTLRIACYLDDQFGNDGLTLLVVVPLLFATIFATILVAVLIIGGHHACNH